MSGGNLHVAIAEVGDAVGSDDAGVELAIFEIAKKADSTVEENGDEVEVDLVKKTGSEVLLGHVVEAVGLVPLV